MNTTRLKSFATEARNTLRRGVMNRLLALGFDQDGNVVQEPTMFEGGAVFMGETISEDFYNKWISLRDRIASHSLREVLEEAAYTWFNRLIAIRIMQKNGLIDPVLDYRSDSVRLPVLLTNAQAGNIPTMPEADRERLRELLNDPTRTAEQFAILITAFCHNTPVINACFGKLADYTELLLPNDILEENGFLDKLNHTDFINNEDYISPELIGWLYQFYISERKDEVMAKEERYEPDEIPAATQLFTPNWIVKYMVQNTVGRIYLDNNPYEDELKSKWKYLVENDSQGEKLQIDDLAEIKVGDLACGSGHILNECFDLLLDLYVNEGYNRRQAIESIFENNLTGIDIDTRAKQLATFALLLKACQKDKSFIDAHAMPHVMDIPDVDRYTWRDLNGHMTCALQIQSYNERVFKELDECFTLMEHANSLGSIMKFDISPETREFILLCLAEQKRQQKFVKSFAELFRGFEIILALTEKYSALVMNPPYMGNKNMDDNLLNYVKKYFSLTSNDLGAVFMDVSFALLRDKGVMGMINQAAWLLKPIYKSYREEIISLENYNLNSALYLGPNSFPEIKGEVVQSVTFVTRKNKKNKTKFFHLKNYPSSFEKRDAFLSHECKIFSSDLSDFLAFSGYQFGFWLNKDVQKTFEESPISKYGDAKQGLKTGNNPYFIKLWFEISRSKWGIKWFPVETGGNFRRWYGNGISVLNWENDGYEIKNFKDSKGKLRSRPQGLQFSFKDGITWSTSASDRPSFRYSDNSYLFESSGSKFFLNDFQKTLPEFCAYFNSKVVKSFIEMLSPGLGISEGAIKALPYISPCSKVKSIANECIDICHKDWDAHEISWDFKTNELISIDDKSFFEIVNDYCDFNHCNLDLAQPEPQKLEWRVDWYKTKWETKFHRLHRNEEELNRQFIDIYGLQDELTPDVPLDEVTILQQGEISIDNNEIVWHDDVIIKQLISYAVGCWMGRYRLDKPGLHIAHTGSTREEIAPYEYNGEPFEIDDDGIIPLMPKDCMFHDNAVQRLADFVRQVFGASTQIENLNFIEEALGMTLEQYFIKYFWKDHKKMYQNRPIYWLFSSKKGAFQCLAYMHRMDAYTVERVRQKYLLPHMEDLRRRIAELAERAASLNTQERKTLESLNKQLDECMEYHERLHPVADKQIAFDLDDGVVVNYAKFGDILAKIK